MDLAGYTSLMLPKYSLWSVRVLSLNLLHNCTYIVMKITSDKLYFTITRMKLPHYQCNHMRLLNYQITTFI